MAFAMMPLCLYIYTPSFIDEAISIPYTNICELQEHAQYKHEATCSFIALL